MFNRSELRAATGRSDVTVAPSVPVSSTLQTIKLKFQTSDRKRSFMLDVGKVMQSVEYLSLCTLNEVLLDIGTQKNTSVLKGYRIELKKVKKNNNQSLWLSSELIKSRLSDKLR